MLALTLSPTLKETTRNCSSVSPSRSSKSTRSGSLVSASSRDKAVARAVASHDADHVAEAVSDTGTAHGDKIIRRGEAFEIAIYQRWQRIDDIVAVQGERIETGFKIADFRAAQDHFPARTVQLQQLRQRLVVQSRVTIAQRLNALFADANKRQLIIERLAGGFICCNNAPDDVSAEALTENNRLPAMSDMAHQSCFITAIAFLKFDSPVRTAAC